MSEYGTYKSGFVAVMGRPNVGKSSLINTFLEQKIAAVSAKPQTTRLRQLGIFTVPGAQIIFEDTPGLHKPRHKLGKWMNELALKTLEEADVALFMVDASQPPHEEDIDLAAILRASEMPCLLVLNKLDLLGGARAGRLPKSPFQAVYSALLPDALALGVSAVRRATLEELLLAVLTLLPEHPPYFPEDQMTDFFERAIAADLLREAALNHLQHEIPYGIAVQIDEYTERGEKGAYITATIFVERESHKAIVIGEGGQMLKKIASAGRREIEKMSGRRVFLEMRVKVRKNWRNDDKALKAFGYA